MKLLVDQNLPPVLEEFLAKDFAGSTHVRTLGMTSALDTDIWEFARRNGFAILSKDSDFRQRSFVLGHPPKVVWIRAGNCSTSHLCALIAGPMPSIKRFLQDSEGALLALP